MFKSRKLLGGEFPVIHGKAIGTAVTACALGLAAFATPVSSVPQTRFLLLQSPGAQKSPSQNKGNNHHAQQSHKMGDWLREHRNLPVDQQEKILENDPNFKKLSKDRQAALKERLRKFAGLPPERQDRALQRMQFMSSLSPEQRKEIRDANQQLQTLPPDRRVMLHATVRHLRQMSPQERQQTLESDRFRSTFSAQEQNILKQLALLPGQAASAPGPAASPNK
ncbi:MAG TPA: DUF3106 domain-containing protein [Terriglobales bacterium]|nr:DUF3106 domain-containing protein [Terriglobales bacterium]